MSDDDAALIGTTDAIRPWTIKSMPNEVRNMVVAAARDEGLTVSQWLERVIRERVAGGRPAPVASPPPAASLGELAQLMQAARGLAEAANVPVPEPLARSALATLGRAVRQARGLPPPKPRHKPPLAIEGA